MDLNMPSVADILSEKIQTIEARLPLRISSTENAGTASFSTELTQSMSQTASIPSDSRVAATADPVSGSLAAETGNGLLGLQLSSLAAQALAAAQRATETGSAQAQRVTGTSAETTPVTWPRLNSTQLEAIAPRVDAAIQESAAATGLDPLLLQALIANESAFQPYCLSSAGAMGLTQLMPGTAQELGVTNPYDIRQNVNGGARYLKAQLAAFGDDLSLALAAYNAGPNAVRSHGGIPPYQETQLFVQRVLLDYNRYRAARGT